MIVFTMYLYLYYFYFGYQYCRVGGTVVFVMAKVFFPAALMFRYFLSTDEYKIFWVKEIVDK